MLIFVKPGRIAADAGQFPLILLVWLFGAGLCVLGGFCLAELSSMHPQAGGCTSIFEKPTVDGWRFFRLAEILFSRPASTGALAVCVSPRWRIALHFELPITLSVPLAIAIVLLLASINIVGVVWGGWMQAVHDDHQMLDGPGDRGIPLCL